MESLKQFHLKINQWVSIFKNRPGWATTDAGIWFLDVKYSDFKNLRINRKSNEKLIIRTVVDKIDRSKLVSRTISTINSQKNIK